MAGASHNSMPAGPVPNAWFAAAAGRSHARSNQSGMVDFSGLLDLTAEVQLGDTGTLSVDETGGALRRSAGTGLRKSLIGILSAKQHAREIASKAKCGGCPAFTAPAAAERRAPQQLAGNTIFGALRTPVDKEPNTEAESKETSTTANADNPLPAANNVGAAAGCQPVPAVPFFTGHKDAGTIGPGSEPAKNDVVPPGPADSDLSAIEDANRTGARVNTAAESPVHELAFQARLTAMSSTYRSASPAIVRSQIFSLERYVGISEDSSALEVNTGCGTADNGASPAGSPNVPALEAVIPAGSGAPQTTDNDAPKSVGLLAASDTPAKEGTKRTAAAQGTLRTIGLRDEGAVDPSSTKDESGTAASSGETNRPLRHLHDSLKNQTPAEPAADQPPDLPIAPANRGQEPSALWNGARQQPAANAVHQSETAREETSVKLTPAPEIETRPATTPRAIEFQLQSDTGRVALRVAGRAGEVTVDVRTSDSRLAGALRADLPELAARIEQTGYHAETWHPASSASARQQAESAIASRQLPGEPGSKYGQGQGKDRHEAQQFQQPMHRKQSRKDFQWLFNSIR